MTALLTDHVVYSLSRKVFKGSSHLTDHHVSVQQIVFAPQIKIGIDFQTHLGFGVSRPA